MTSILISGAGIAGSSLALWAARYGLAATVVEAAPRLRVGGSAVDFRGRAHLRVLADMGVLDELRAVATGGTPMRFVDRDGRTRLDLPGDFAGGDLEVQRGDLVRIVYEHACPGAEFRFGERISELVDGRAGVEVTFASGARRRFDLVVGADGVHSGMRRLAFGPERDHVRHLGYHLATWDVPDHLGLGRQMLAYNEPGRMVSITGDPRDPGRATALAVFASEPLPATRGDRDADAPAMPLAASWPPAAPQPCGCATPGSVSPRSRP